eukprot:snap_masked-scaffold_6-processed-gene-1.27-mRNA-1 protein AED:1.00 eAED:1.00 QI:0/-1/0/0/-1/1/1/0/104
MCRKQFYEALLCKSQNTELEIEEVDYIQLTNVTRKIVEELILSKKCKGFHRKNSPPTLELIKVKWQRWGTTSVEEGRRVSRVGVFIEITKASREGFYLNICFAS